MAPTSPTPLLRTALLTLLLSPLASPFSLNVSGPDWDYVSSDLAPSTSPACRSAYSAPIACDDTLLGLVASMRPLFNPTPADLERTCTASCGAALDAYIEDVRRACGAEGDAAQEDLGGSSPMNRVPVEVVGQLFQYTLARSCTRDATNAFCYSTRIDYDIPCTSRCDIAFFGLAHQYAASEYIFIYYWLTDRGSWWADEFAKGWERVKVCGKDAPYEPVVAVVTTQPELTTTAAAVSGTAAGATGTAVADGAAATGSGEGTGDGSPSTTKTAVAAPSADAIAAASSSSSTSAAAAAKATSSGTQSQALGSTVLLQALLYISPLALYIFV